MSDVISPGYEKLESTITHVRSTPDISVLIYCYNFAPYIKECIESILRQSLSPKEICIYDDCSSDQSWEIITALSRQYPYRLTIHRHQQNIGMTLNGNFGMQRAKCNWVSWIDGDDRWHESKLEYEWKCLGLNPDARIAYSNVSIISSDGEIIKSWDDVNRPKAPSGNVFEKVFSKNFFPNSGSVFRNHLQHRCVFDKIGYMDENLSLYIDWDYKIRATKHFLCAYTPKPTVEYRIHSGGIHNLPPSVHHDDVLSIFKKHVKLLKDIPLENQLFIIKSIAQQIKSFNPKINPISILSSIASESGLCLSMDHKKKLNRPSYLSKPANENSSKTVRPCKSAGIFSQPKASKTLIKKSFSDHSHIIFLISLPRSGSTLLQRILGGHASIHTTAEPWVMLHPLHAFKTNKIKSVFDENLAAAATQDFLSTIPENMELYFQAVRAYGLTLYNRALEISGKELFLDKTPRYYSIIPELSQTFPNSRFIILLRNPLAVMSSVLQTWFRNDPQILSTTANQRDLIDGPRLLLDGITMLENKAHVVHYEQLVSEPEMVIRSLCDYLEISYSDEMLDYGNREAPRGRFGDNVGINRHKKPVSDSINSWRKNLTSPTLRQYAVDYLHRLGHDTVARMGYDFDAIASTLNTDENTSGNMIIGSQESPAGSFLLSSQNGIKKRYEQLLETLKGKDRATITEGLQQFLTIYPGFPEVHNDLGVLYGENGAYNQAYEYYQKAVFLDSRNITFQKNLADFQYFVRKDIPSALNTYTTMLKSNPMDTEVLYAIGYISAELGKREDANVFFNRILEIDPVHYKARCAIGVKPNYIATTARLYENKSAVNLASNTFLQTNNPVVSAIVSVYNAEKYLKGCLEDLLSQSIAQMVEIIIVDSGSIENEKSIANRFQERYDNIQYIRTENRETVYAAWNRAIKAARGKYITNANADDRHRSDAFEIMVRILDQKPEIALVYADCLITETENETFDKCSPVGAYKWLDWNREQLINRGCFMGPQPMWRRSLHDEYGYFDPEYVTSGDYEFWLRISQTNVFYHISEYLGLYLRSPQSIEHSNREKQRVENKRLLNMYRKASAQKKIIRKKAFLNTPETKNDKSVTTESIDQTISLFEREEYGDALTNLHLFLSDHPDHWEAYELLVDVMLQSGQDMDIPNKLHDLEKRSNLPARMMALIGQGYEASGNLEKAADFVAQALTIDSECARALNLRGVIAYRNGHGSEAAQFFQKAAEYDENWGDPWTNMGTLHWDRGDQDKALDCFETGFLLSPTGPNVATTYHIAISETGQYKRAREQFEEIVSRYPDFRRGRFFLVDVLIRLEAYQAALDQIEAVLVRFEADAQLLEAAKAVRSKVGPLTIKMNKHPSLSLCMIVKNEEKYLARCLASLKPMVDEMIVVDTGSTDATHDIAEIFGAKVFDFEWNDDFATARNHSLVQATGDWILVMDADEVIATSDHGKILDLIKKSKNNKHAYVLTTRNYTDRQDSSDYSENTGQYKEEMSTGWIPSKKVRLFQNQKGVHFVFPVHEQVDPVLSDMGISLVESPIPVHHYGKLDQARTAERWQTYYDIGHKKLASQPDNDHALKELAIQAGLLSKWEEAATYWKSFIDRNPASIDGYLNLTRVMANCGDYEQANRYAGKAFQLAGDRSETIYNLALSELQTGQAAKAAKTANRMVDTFPDDSDGKLLHALAEICAGKIDIGTKLLFKMFEIVPIVSLLPRIRSILRSIKSAGFDDWVLILNAELSKIVNLEDMVLQPTTPSKNKAVVINKTTVGADENTSTLFEKAARYYERENYQAALDSLLYIVAAESDHWEAYELLVDVMLQSGQDMDIPNQLRALENRSDLPARMMALIGQGYEASENLEKATDFVSQALTIDPECARAWNLKGIIAYRKGHGSEAAQFFQKASEYDGDWGDPWTNFGTIYWEQGNTEKALDCFQKGFILSPTAPNVATTYHIAISKTGQYERARPLFEQAVKRLPNFRKGRFLLIDILIRMEAYPEALNQIETVLVRFGAEPQFLEAAKTVRDKVGPMTIKKGKHPSLSLCMIVKNEEKYLSRCLESLKPMVDEMIIVDTGSTDATRDIAEVFGAKVFDFEWNDDFAAARNFSLDKASSDWILIMDADEVIAAEDQKHMRNLIKKSSSNRYAFMVVTRNYTHQYNIIGREPNAGQYPAEETGTGWIPSEKVRLFPNDDAIRFEYPVHEVVGPALARKGISVKSCPYPIHHYGKMDQALDRQKDERYYKIGMEKLSLSPDDPIAIRELAIQAGKLGKNKDAIALWKRLIELQPNIGKSYINLSSNYGKLETIS